MPIDVLALTGLSAVEVSRLVDNLAAKIYAASDPAPQHAVVSVVALATALAVKCQRCGVDKEEATALLLATWKSIFANPKGTF